MNGRGGRQFSRGGVSGGPEPPRRRRFRGQYVRRRTPSGNYRGGSFSDDRNDSSPPPNIANRQMPVDEPPFAPLYQQPRVNRQRPRGMRHYDHGNNPPDRQFYDNHYQRQPPRNFEASDNEYNDDHRDQLPPHSNPHTQNHHHHPNQHQQSMRKLDDLTRSFESLKTDISEMKSLVSKLNVEMEQVKARVKELEATRNPTLDREQGPFKEADKDKRRKAKFLKQRERKATKLAEKRAAISGSTSQKILNSEQTTTSASDKPEVLTGLTQVQTTREHKNDKRRFKTTKPLPKVNDDSTTQAAEPSSEDRQEGDDARDGSNKERVKVFRRKKQTGRRAYGNRRRRGDSSNDTSPQGEANGNDEFEDKRKKNGKKNFPELTESELSEVVQNLKREFVNVERPLKAIKSTMNEKGPKVVFEFAVSILDHAICDVTSPTKLSEIANNLYQLLVSEDNTSEVDFQQGFYEALNDISKREDDIAIDAPRYLDTLGQVLADCVAPMLNKHKNLIKKFLNKSLESYCQQNRALLLANIMKGVASIKNDRYAKDVWDAAQLKWETFLAEGTDLNEFLESHEVKFTTQAFSPEPNQAKKAPKELEKFADDVTSLVEKRCTSQALDDLVKDLNLESEEKVDYLGTLVYAIVRGCLLTDSGIYKLNNDALNKYSSILNVKHENRDAIALYALTALTKLWHQYNCPQDLFRTILMALHNQGSASYEVLKEWLNSESLTNIPGIGAARLNSKRYIEDLGGANSKS